MKKIISILLTAAMVIAMLPVAEVATSAEGGTLSTGLTWDLTGSTLTISGDGDMPDFSSSLPSPWYVNREGIYTIVIGDGVTVIGDYAFRGCFVDSITIPDGVTRIGNNAFDRCGAITSIIIPDSVTSIGNNAFQSCDNLPSIIIPDSVITIGDNVFYNCRELASIKIGKNVTSIGGSAFKVCHALDSLEFTGSTPPSFGSDIFEGIIMINGFTIYVPVNSLAAYKAVEQLSGHDIVASILHKKGRITQNSHDKDEVAVADAVHIFMYLAKMSSSIINIDATGRAYAAACITGDKPSVADAVHIFMFLAKMSSSKVPK